MYYTTDSTNDNTAFMNTVYSPRNVEQHYTGESLQHVRRTVSQDRIEINLSLPVYPNIVVNNGPNPISWSDYLTGLDCYGHAPLENLPSCISAVNQPQFCDTPANVKSYRHVASETEPSLNVRKYRHVASETEPSLNVRKYSHVASETEPFLNVRKYRHVGRETEKCIMLSKKNIADEYTLLPNTKIILQTIKWAIFLINPQNFINNFWLFVFVFIVICIIFF